MGSFSCTGSRACGQHPASTSPLQHRSAPPQQPPKVQAALGHRKAQTGSASATPPVLPGSATGQGGRDHLNLVREGP